MDDANYVWVFYNAVPQWFGFVLGGVQCRRNRDTGLYNRMGSDKKYS